MPNQKMKSLTLHLLAILLVGSLHNPNNNSNNNNKNHFWPRAAAAASPAEDASASASPTAAPATPPTTTTLQPPSLPRPRSRALPTTAMMMTSSSTSTSTSTTTAATTPAATVLGRRMAAPVGVGDVAPLASTQLVRSAAGSVRQNRSFQSGGGSAAALQLTTNGNNNNVADSLKPSRLQRRQQQQHQQQSFRPNQLTTTTPSSAPSTADGVQTTSRSSSSSSEPPTKSRQQHQKKPQQRDEQQQQQRDDEQQQQQHRQQLRTTKTPRMIQRLVAGHIQNAEGHSTFQVSSVTTNSSVSHSMSSSMASSTTPRPASALFRRKSGQSSTYRQSKLEGSNPQTKPPTRRGLTTTTTTTTTTASTPVRLQTILDVAEDREDDDGRDDDDEALLDDEAGDFDNWEHGILRLSAGSGKEDTAKAPKKKLKQQKEDDSKKTLADQVRDGKYGLIEKELFRRVPKRPGVLSYLPNKEVPVDNDRTYGGLHEEDIWLAEDHLLVIKGGGLNEGEPNEPWPPIDDYDAPERQIKIPPNPKVPPPFPVQLEANGPLQFIGDSKFTIVNPVANESVPVYPAGPAAADYAPPGPGDDTQDVPAGPGATADAGPDEPPGYAYPPPPYPPAWLYHNQTFVNPALNGARPISFPWGLGPFPFARNGSSSPGSDNDNDNGADYFDEDDPGLYYPPAYSFVYRNNYSNPVPPGPIVPGIVLPPPADHFSRLEKPAKTGPSSSRHRGHHPSAKATTSTTTTSTTTTTTTTTTRAPTTTTSTTSTTAAPFRQVLTKITEYTPKTITIGSGPPTPPPSPTPTPTPTSPLAIEPIPVPVAVPVPIYPSKHFASGRPALVAFVPTTPGPDVETFSKSNPIYYEYFEPKRQPALTSTANAIDFEPTTAKPRPGGAASKPAKLYTANKRPFKTAPPHHRNFLQAAAPHRQFVQENVVYITPKPDIRPYSYKAPPPAPATPPPRSQSAPPQAGFKQRPLDSFEREVNAIRQTLRFYQNQQLRDNNIPRTPKAKAVYEYAFDATQSQGAAQGHSGYLGGTARPSFQPPLEYDEEPFKPMVTYSPPVDDANAFRAIAAYDKVDSEQGQAPVQRQPKYQSTTTLIPVQVSSAGQYADAQGRSKKLRLGGAKYLEQPQSRQAPQQPQYLEDFQSTPRTVLTTQPPWVSLDKQVVDEYQEQPQARQQPERLPERLQLAPKNRGFSGYYYGSPPPPPPPPAPVQVQGRQNHRFYDEPFQNPVRKVVNYRPQQQQQPIQQQQQQPVWSLENDTYVNFAPNRPPLNPDAEFINPYQNLPLKPGPYQGQRYSPPPALSHQSQYYGPPPQRFPPRQQQPQPQPQQIPLHRDILVNYRQPLPPLNPDSEYVSHPQVVRNPVYRPGSYRLPPVSPQPPLGHGEPANVYYIKPQYRRGVSNNNNSGNNNGNRQ